MKPRPKNALAHRPELDGDVLRPLAEVLSRAERKHMIRALEQTDGNVAEAAKAISTDRRRIHRKVADVIEGYRKRPVAIQEVE